ncbi:ABC transporter substrate-binding protein [Nonomuraea sp. NPDC050153]|uniref:ABC transporter substrate-binding protein n=1 Tax=Nonomuraea sp. NPDC050153 TaxID=3364359 RepID=UPI0037AAB0ED
MIVRGLIGCGLLASLVLAMTGCGGTDAGTGAGVEKAQITVGTAAVPAAAPLHIALKRGFFADEGLTVKVETIQTAQAAMPKILRENIDIFSASYAGFVSIQASKTADLKILADATRSAPGTSAVVVPADSAIAKPQDLRGKKVGVNSLKSLGQLMVERHLKDAGLSSGEVTFVPVPFGEQLGAMKTGKVDAMLMIEPLISGAKADGARTVIDTTAGPTQGLPSEGWFTTAQWAGKYPKTLAAFQRALAKGQQVAASDRAAVIEIIPTYVKQLSKEVVSAMAMPVYPAAADPAQVQRVADLMKEFGYVTQPVDAASAVVKPGG